MPHIGPRIGGCLGPQAPTPSPEENSFPLARSLWRLRRSLSRSSAARRISLSSPVSQRASAIATVAAWVDHQLSHRRSCQQRIGFPFHPAISRVTSLRRSSISLSRAASGKSSRKCVVVTQVRSPGANPNRLPSCIVPRVGCHDKISPSRRLQPAPPFRLRPDRSSRCCADHPSQPIKLS